MSRSGKASADKGRLRWPDLSDPVRVAVEKCGWSWPTPVQAALVPAVLSGADVFLRAPSGTGRTGGLGVALAEKLRALDSSDARRSGPLGVIYAFTAEDVDRMTDALLACGVGEGEVAVAYSGIRLDKAAATLRKGASYLVGTTGRITELVARGAVTLDSLKLIAVLEADLLAQLGLLDEIASLFEAANNARPDKERVQTVLIAAEDLVDPPQSLSECLLAASRVEVQGLREGLTKLAPFAMEVAEDEKPDVLLRMITRHATDDRLVLVITRSELEAASVADFLARHFRDGQSWHVAVDKGDWLPWVSSSERGPWNLVVSLHLPLDPTAPSVGEVAAGGVTVLVNCEEYWDLVRTGIIRLGRQSEVEETKVELDESSSCSATGEAADAVVSEPEAEELEAVEPETERKKPGLTRAEKAQRRYARRDAARKIERLAPEEAGKEATRLVRESLAQAAFEQAYASVEPSEAEKVEELGRAGVPDRKLAELLRRQDVEERLRDAEASLAADWQGPEEEEIATLPELPPVFFEAASLTEEEVRLVAWATTIRSFILSALADWQSRKSKELETLAEYLITRYSARDVVGALLASVVPAPEELSADSYEEAGPEISPEEKGWTRLFISVGRVGHATREQIERLLIKEAGLRADEVGRIDVLARYTFVDVRSERASQVLAKLAGVDFRGRRLTVARAKRPKNGY